MVDGEANKTEPGGQSPDQEHSRVNYQKLQRENDKLQYEIEELRRWRQKLYLGFFSALLSPFVAAFTFLLGLNASRGNERIQEQDASYQQLLNGVGSSSPSQRLVSVTGLQRIIAEPPKRSVLGRLLTLSPLEVQEEHARNQRADDAAELLVAKLRDETDPGVVHASLDALAMAQHPPIEAIASINRAAALSFARSSGRLSALLILRSLKKRELDQNDLCGEVSTPTAPTTKCSAVQFSSTKISGTRGDIETELSNLVLRTPSPYDGVSQINSAFLVWPFLYGTPFNHDFAKEQRATLDDDARKRPPTDQEVETARKDFLQLSLFLQGTSAALELALHTRTGKLQGKDLSRIALVSGDLENVDLSGTKDLPGAKLDNSYLAVFAGGTSFDQASLVGANLVNMTADGRITFGSAILHDSIAPDKWCQPAAIDSDICQILKDRKDKPAIEKSGPSLPPGCRVPLAASCGS
jgi:hypothetical protein